MLDRPFEYFKFLRHTLFTYQIFTILMFSFAMTLYIYTKTSMNSPFKKPSSVQE